MSAPAPLDAETSSSSAADDHISLPLSPGSLVGIRTPNAQDEDLERNAAAVLPAPSENLCNNFFLHVVDMPFDGSDPTDVFLAKDPAKDISTSLRTLGQHPEHVTRIFDYTIDKELIPPEYEGPIRQSLIGHIADAYGKIHGDLELMTSSSDSTYESGFPATDIDAICSQLNQKLTSNRLDRIRTRTTLCRDEVSGQLQARNSSFCCVEVEGNRLLVMIVNYSKASFTFSSRAKTFNFSNPRLKDRLLSRQGWARLVTGAPKICAAALTPDFLLTSVHMQPARSFDYFEINRERRQLLPMFLGIPHAYKKILRGSDAEVAYQPQTCAGILQDVQDVTEAILFLLTVLNLVSSGSQINFESIHRMQYLKIREICSQRRLNCERRIERISRTLETRNKLLSMRESTSVKRLTILAAIFLPASLASSFLSMSTRFHELGPILFDWLGGFVLISSVTVVVYFAVKVILHLRSKGWRVYRPRRAYWAIGGKLDNGLEKLGARVSAALQLSLHLSIWALVLASFILGMFRSISLGNEVLFYGDPSDEEDDKGLNARL
ncbi:uncharacterized protein Z520_11944 [Fonsecaea multimorphosa CBS 102226]|uniref:Uncharacterized protein n=1 Tax=Fonsecaea multimorphosa CBS 102226 TaxID=1442371 RepID=A0A0D2I517_9EURO|nr:uncharacterized protein Z520_11944 [Fonsecaea multimorphosa CBS 102226]KIX92336.1 hypothetical protein Z520_11944 [Fonsecaea multimorphosa CBS 102226]